MMERCPACSADVNAEGALGGIVRCDRCGKRFASSAKAARARATVAAGNDPMGIHPALAKRYARVAVDGAAEVNALPAAPKPIAGDTRVLGAAPSLEGPALESPALAPPAGVVEEDTSPGRPAARRSLEGPRPERSTEKLAAAKPAPKPAAKPASEPLPTIPGYEVLEMIGKGAMGRVYRARHIVSGRAAAIKTLAPELAVRPDFVQRFEREGAAMRAINHPGVVQVWDQGCAGADVYYIAMAFIDGHPLRKYLEGGPLPLSTALRFTRRILHALTAAHTPGVIHRDLKPENILMHGKDGDERPVLVDFGLAGILEEENDPHPNLTKSRMTMGTVNYMAPEQRTDAKRVDQRADIYAAGVIFYELITGDLPLGRFKLPGERGFGVPASVDVVVDKALARSADQRYLTAADFDAALLAIERELQLAPLSPTIPPSLERDTLVGDTVPGRSAREPARELRRDSSEPGLTSGMTLAPAGASSTMMESIAQPAWVTMMPTVTTKWLAGGVALFVGTLLGLLLLR